MRTLRLSLLLAAALLANAMTALAAAPTAPPTVLLGPAGTVDEKTPVTFRIQGAAADQRDGRWAVLISGGNDEVLELEPTASDQSVYERTIKFHNAPVYAGTRSDDTVDFSLPRRPSRIFPGTVTWRAVFFPDSVRSAGGDKRTRTAKQTFELAFDQGPFTHLNKPHLPSAKSHRIVPGTSIGGIRPGFTRRQVINRWGEPFSSYDQFFDRTDDWGHGTVSDGQATLHGDSAEVYFDQDIARTIELRRRGGRPLAFSRWRTSRGIHLGSTLRAVEKAYPRSEALEDEDGNFDGLVLRGKVNETVFDFNKHDRLNFVQVGPNSH